MFDDLIRKISELEKQQTISIPIQSDEDGYFDKECPNAECLFKFKIKESEYETDTLTCPMCGKKGKEDTFYTTEQIKQAEEQAINHISGQINNALHDSARSFNRSQPKKGFLQISMNVKGLRMSTTILPITALEEIQRKIVCSNCESDYAVIGSAYFCPLCGFNYIEQTFEESIKTIKFKIDNADKIKALLSESDIDQASNTQRVFLESALGDIVTAFQ